MNVLWLVVCSITYFSVHCFCIYMVTIEGDNKDTMIDVRYLL